MSAQTAAILRESAESIDVGEEIRRELFAAADVVESMKVSDSKAVAEWVNGLFDLSVVKQVMAKGVRT